MTGHELKQLLEDNGIRQTFLASITGLRYETINRMLNSSNEISDSVKLAIFKQWGWE